MKIIEKKQPFENWTLRVTCTGGTWNQGDKVPCDSILEIDKNDLVKREWSKYPDEHGTSYGFICPVCGCFTDLSKKELKPGLEALAKDYFEVIKEGAQTSNE